MNINECLFGKTVDICTWVQHAFIAVCVVCTLALIIPGSGFVTATGVSAAFIWRETQGPDQHIPWYRRLVATSDRIGDWTSPTVAAFIVALLFSFVEPSAVNLVVG